MSEIIIAGRRIGSEQPPLVIAEVGINHEGDINKALQLVDAAAAAGNIAPAMETRAIATLICTMADGMMVRRATLPDYDPGREIPAVMHLICALVSGAVPAMRPTDSTGVTS